MMYQDEEDDVRDAHDADNEIINSGALDEMFGSLVHEALDEAEIIKRMIEKGRQKKMLVGKYKSLNSMSPVQST